MDNIYTVCLCNSDDLKSKQTDFNNIWQLIVDELAILESNGIMVNGTNVKGTLVHSAFDNLGANIGLGFSGSFSSNKYCRHCVSKRVECQQFTSESECSLRTIESYENSLAIVDESETVNLDMTDGVKIYCVLSNLNYYHILDNPTADIMHDIGEGCIPRLLEYFFEYCFKRKIFKSDELDNLVKSYDFGILNIKNIPSEINFKNRSLNQNASQSMCLFIHLPYILNKYRNHKDLEKPWQCIETLLQICEIVTSYEITELEIQRLEKVTKSHLSLFQSVFETNLIPKQHFLLHYPGIIRKVGPLRYFDMMRYDAKHRTFKISRNATNNFKNINKTLALKHQQMLCLAGFTYTDNFEHGMLHPVCDELLANLFLNEPNKLFKTSFLRFNNYRYRKEGLIVQDESFFKIAHIIFDEQNFFFICWPMVIKTFDNFLNSFEIEQPLTEQLVPIKFSDLLYTKSHEFQEIGENNYVICDSLDLRFNLNK